jgi:3-hydroxybutyryl-CoA dehydratase
MMAIRVGTRATREFVVDDAAMCRFQALSGDTSLIHCDAAHAKARGYDGVIVYGGIMLAHLSHLLGMEIPGRSGVSMAWSIKFHGPLYVGEAAQIVLEVVNVSAANGVVDGRFSIMAGAKKVATGTTQSIVPRAPVGSDP